MNNRKHMMVKAMETAYVNGKYPKRIAKWMLAKSDMAELLKWVGTLAVSGIDNGYQWTSMK